PLAFQALVALHGARDVADDFALFPDQRHAIDAAIALIEEGQIGDEATGKRYPNRLHGPFAHAEHGEKLLARHRYRGHAHQPGEDGGYEHAPPLVLPMHTLILLKSWRSS